MNAIEVFATNLVSRIPRHEAFGTEDNITNILELLVRAGCNGEFWWPFTQTC
jgi:hypothetical protein